MAHGEPSLRRRDLNPQFQVEGLARLTSFSNGGDTPPLATSESNRALPPYQGGPFDRLGRGQRKVEVSIFQAAKPARVFKARCRAGGAPSNEESGGPDPQRANVQRLSGQRPRPWRVHSPWSSSPARCDQAGDGRGRRTRIPALSRPPGFRPGPARLAGSSSKRGRRSNRS
jgi:hypothetical protein